MSDDADRYLLLAVAFGSANPVKYFSKAVKAWDAAAHPKGAKGLFIETPDKVKAGEVKVGDVVTTKNGKSFKVEKPTAKGVKVNPLDPDTGEQKAGYTVLGHGVDVALVEKSHAPGSSHAIGQLEPGTIVKAKNGKRFKVAKHGAPSTSKTGQVKAYTTVYPVDDKGDVTGKHTVLPQDHVVTVDAPEVVAHPTAADVKKVDQAMDAAMAQLADAIAPGLDKPVPKPGALKPGDFLKPHDLGEETIMLVEQTSVDPVLGPLWVVVGDATGTEFPMVESDLLKGYDKQKVWDVAEAAAAKAAESWQPAVGDQVADDTGTTAIVTGYDGEDQVFVLKIDHSGTEIEESASALKLHYTKVEPASDPYPHTVEGLAKKLVDQGLASSGGQNAVYDVKQAFADAAGWADAAGGWPDGGYEFVSHYAPAWLGTKSGDDAAQAYDEWHGVAASKATDAPAGAELKAALDALAEAQAEFPTMAGEESLVIQALKKHSDWQGYEVKPTVEALQATALWKTVDSFVKDQTGVGLGDAMAEKVALGQAKAAAAAPKPSSPQEVLPKRLPKVPKAYPAGVGEKTSIQILQGGERVFGVWRMNAVGERVQLVGTAGTATEAKKLARDASADHEPIVLQPVRPRRNEANAALAKAEVGAVVMDLYGHVYRVAQVTETQEALAFQQGTRTKRRVLVERPGDGQKALQKALYLTQDPKTGEWYDQVGTWTPLEPGDEAEALFQKGKVHPQEAIAEYEKLGLIAKSPEETVRKARPERYTKHLQQDWDASELVGGTVNDALKSLNKLGYREIKPRLKDQVRVVRADGKRLHLSRTGTTITAVNEILAPKVLIEGTARDWHDQLAEALAAGGDLKALDPADLPADARTSHVRQMVYDMAVGRQNGVAEKLGKGAEGPKVKTDAQYVAEVEADGGIGSVDEFKAAADRPPYVVSNVRSGSLAQFAIPATQEGAFATDEPLTEWEATALSAIMKRQGVAQLLGQKEIPGFEAAPANWLPELKASDPVEGARKLAAAWETYQAAHGVTGGEHGGYPNPYDAVDGDEGPIGKLPVETQTYLVDNMQKWQILAETVMEVRDAEWTQRAENLRAEHLKDEIAGRRAKEGTVAYAPNDNPFDLPVWDEIEFEAQDYIQIDQLAAGIGGTPHDVPAFYSGGALQDGVLYHRPDQSNGKVPYELDQMVVERLSAAGAIQEANRDPIAEGVAASYKHFAGQQLTVTDAGGDLDLAKAVAKEIYDDNKAALPSYAQPSDEDYDAVDNAGTLEQLTALFEGTPQSVARISEAAGGVDKRIEYVMHDQASWNAGGAPTSQRGTLRMVGYTPREAAERLRELGLLGDLEPEVPFKALMRGPRRYGALAPLHPAYVRGEAELPDVRYRITHGMTASGQTGIDALKSILDSGGLMSIAERHRQGILHKVKGASVGGDIRSGIDHGVFCTTDGHGAVGSGAGVRFVMKPQAYLRRDVLLAPEDFGGAETRYNQYKTYLNKLQKEAGVPRTNLYEPVDPKVRQLFIDQATGASSEEFNIGPLIPIEDIEAIGVQTQADVASVNAHLDGLLAKGVIAAKPRVVLNEEAKKLASTGVTKPGGSGSAHAPEVGGVITNTGSGVSFKVLGDLGDSWEVQAVSNEGGPIATAPIVNLSKDLPEYMKVEAPQTVAQQLQGLEKGEQFTGDVGQFVVGDKIFVGATPAVISQVNPVAYQWGGDVTTLLPQSTVDKGWVYLPKAPASVYVAGLVVGDKIKLGASGSNVFKIKSFDQLTKMALVEAPGGGEVVVPFSDLPDYVIAG